jgi:uncharacterized membrane protein
MFSCGQLAPHQEGDQIGGRLPTNLLDVAGALQGIPFWDGTKISKAKVAQLALTPLAPAQKTFYNHPNYAFNPIPYTPFVIGIWATRLVDSNPIALLRGARFAGLAMFLAIVFVAIRSMPVHKYVMFAVALTPMTLFQASSVTYDTLCVALSFLIVALSVSFAMRDAEISNREFLAFILVTVLQRFAKDGYFLVPLLFFLIPQKNIGPKWKSAAMLLILGGVYFVPQMTWGAFLSSLHLHGGQIFQNDFRFDPAAQFEFYRGRPIELVRNLGLNVLAQGRFYIVGALGRFGYSYIPLPETALFLHGLFLVAVSVLDTTPSRTLALRQKCVAFCVAAGTIGTILGGFLFVFSPVGARLIFGLQGRYFIPVIPILLLLNYNTSIRNDFWEKWKCYLVPGYAICILGYTVNFIGNKFWIP